MPLPNHFEAATPPADVEESPDDLRRDEIASILRTHGLGACMAGCAADEVIALIARTPTASAEAESVSDVMIRTEGTVREMLRSIIRADRPKLQARLWLIARGAELDNADSMRRIASEYGITPEAVSKAAAKLRADRRLPPNQHNKSERARARYRMANRPNCRSL